MVQGLTIQAILERALELDPNQADAWDSGADQALRRQRQRNFWTVLFFSRGLPMTAAGLEKFDVAEDDFVKESSAISPQSSDEEADEGGEG